MSKSKAKKTTGKRRTKKTKIEPIGIGQVFSDEGQKTSDNAISTFSFDSDEFMSTTTPKPKPKKASKKAKGTRNIDKSMPAPTNFFAEFDLENESPISQESKPKGRTGRRTGLSTITPVSFEDPINIDTSNPQVSLLNDFWADDKSEDEDEKEEERLKELFTDSVQNTKSSSRNSDDSLSKRIQVGLYPADAELLEELYLQSKTAGLKNVSRARILRVALRHFHTCWLNADQS